MLSEELRALVREVLREELAPGRQRAQAAPAVREEYVRLESDSDVAAFVTRILDIARDSGAVREIREGRHRFRLSRSAAAPAARHGAPPPEFSRGLISEKQVQALAEDTREVRAAPGVKFTPLALDELRRRGIKVMRERK